MNSLRTLHDAFDALERRADVVPSESFPEPAFHEPEPPRARKRHAAPIAAAVVVAAVAAGVAAWQHASSGRTTHPAGRATAPASAASAHNPGRYQPPATPELLAAKARSILAGIATITVTDTGSPEQVSLPPASTGKAEHLPGVHAQAFCALTTATAKIPLCQNAEGAKNGSAIVGQLTAAGRTGGYDLNVFRAEPGAKAACDLPDAGCTIRSLPGGSLAINVWHDPQVSGGLTYQLEFVRSDGADVLVHLSTERDPKGQSSVTAARLPLTVEQLTDFVTSPRW